MCRVTGELADGWLPTTLDLDEYELRWGQVRAGAEAAGRDADDITAGMWAYTVVAEDDETARRIVTHPMVKAFTLALPDAFFTKRGYEHPLGTGTHGFLEYIPSRLSREEALRAIDAIPDEIAIDAIIHGSPSTLAKIVERYAKVGLRHIALWNITFFAGAELIGPSYKLLTEAKDEIKALGF